jgi:hypothetical protein
MNKTATTKVKLPKELVAELDALPARSRGQVIEWTDELDALLLAYWPIKQHREVLEWWKKTYGWGSHDTLLKRYRELKGNQ